MRFLLYNMADGHRSEFPETKEVSRAWNHSVPVPRVEDTVDVTTRNNARTEPGDRRLRLSFRTRAPVKPMMPLKECKRLPSNGGSRRSLLTWCPVVLPLANISPIITTTSWRYTAWKR